MWESFSDYKKTIESNLINISFLYSGDVIKSSEFTYSEVRNNPLISPSFIINCLINIYNKSFEEMMNKSEKIFLTEELFFKNEKENKNFSQTLKELNICHDYIFTSGKNSIFFVPCTIQPNKPFPNYFYESKNFEPNVDVLISPLIEESESETVIFLTNKPIQSLVYSIQNMDYKVIPDKNNSESFPNLMRWTHEIKYPFYYCDYKSIKLTIRDISSIRDKKISELFNDN